MMGDHCLPNERACKSGQCLPEYWFCDGQEDCLDGSDERNCVQTCNHLENSCANGMCIPKSFFCDGHPDCSDGSDENECDESMCSENQFPCASGKCISAAFLCDGEFDCGFNDFTDELECDQGEVQNNQRFLIRNKIILLNLTKESCSAITNFKCQSDDVCLSRQQFCDGNIDCQDGSDEQNCVCAIDEFTCANQLNCISRADHVCNGISDCSFGEDEADCGDIESVDEKIFCNGKIATKCDNVVECEDGEDEFDCDGPDSSETAHPKNPEDCLEVEFFCSGKCLARSWRCDGQPDCEDGLDEVDCFECPSNMFKCNDETCITYDSICDGIMNCANGEDESIENCGSPPPEPCRGFQCQDLVCINMTMICDGIVQCTEGEDESACGNTTMEPERDCSGLWCDLKESNRTGCLKMSSVCDGEEQCRDGRDEAVCRQWSEWTSWSDCSVDCNSGKSVRTRICPNKEDNDDILFTCPGPSIQERPCFDPCEKTNQQWSDWSTCSSSCGGGTSVRFIQSDASRLQSTRCNLEPCLDEHGNPICSGSLTYQQCGPCKTNCGDSEECKECGASGCYCPKGYVFENNGNSTGCIQESECKCDIDGKIYDPDTEVSISNCEVCVCSNGKLTHCKIKSLCEEQDYDEAEMCSWSSWGSWGPCFGPCGVNGIQWSFRSPAIPSVYGIEERCQGASKKSRRCRTNQCSFCHDADGNTKMVGAQWRNGCTVCRCTRTGIVQCNKFCEYQLVSNGCPANTTLQIPDDECCFCAPESQVSDIGSEPCEENQFRCSSNSKCISNKHVCNEVEECNDGSDESFCDECLMTTWSAWSQCSTSCGIGARSRTRAIRLENRKLAPCADKSFKDIQHCQLRACPIDGYYSPWETWSSCDRPCNGGLRQRTRTCYQPKNGGESCSGPSINIEPCNLAPCVPMEGCFGDKNLLTASCEDVCPATCAEISAEVDCVQKCQNSAELVTGCFCKGNLLLQDGVCVPKSQCNCHHQGRAYLPGIHIIDECNCVCENGEMICEENCISNRRCNWGSWSTWSICFTNDNSCNQTGVRHRFRTPQAKYQLSCAGESSESEKCVNPCPSIWGEWSAECNINTESDVCPTVVPVRNRSCSGLSCQVPADGSGKRPGFIQVMDCCGVTCENGMDSCDECKVATCAAAQILDDSCIVHYNSTKLMSSNRDNANLKGCLHQCSCPFGLFRNEDECVPRDQCYCILPNLTKIETGTSFDEGCLKCTCTGASFHCDKKENCIDEGLWSKWSVWSTCSSTCISEKVYPQQSRYRSCRAKNSQTIEFFEPWLKNHQTEFACSGRGIETVPCGNIPVCGDVFVWSEWSKWSDCQFCIQRRSRGCLFNGKITENQNCAKDDNEESRTCPCRAEDCPADAYFISNTTGLVLENAYCNGGKRGPTTDFCVCTDDKKINHFGECVSKDMCSCRTDETGNIQGGDHFKSKLAGQCTKNCKCSAGEIMCSIGDCAECMFGEWSTWSTCSTSCGVGNRVRFQMLMFQTSSKCPTNHHQIEDCSIESCDKNAGISAWTEWGTCSKTCGSGAVRNRYLHDKLGETQDIQTEFCSSLPECSEMDSTDSPWQWSAWSACSKTCGGYGVSYRFRNTNDSGNRMKHCTGVDCSTKMWTDLSDERLCGSVAPCFDTPESCPNGTLWNDCGRPCMETCANIETCDQTSGTCKAGCFCNDPNQIFDHVSNSCVAVSSCHCFSQKTGAILSPADIEKQDCNTCRCTSGRLSCTMNDCSVVQTINNWCGWSAWSTCSRTCGSGWPQIRSRINKCGCHKEGSNEGCDDFTDQFGSELVKVEHQDCHVYPKCPTDGNWGSWGSWSTCNCGTFRKYKTRSCNDPSPALGGKKCEGNSLVSESCADHECDGQCPSGTSFVECANCETTCASISKSICNNSDCKNSCACPRGNLMNRNGKCIPRSQCECSATINGQYKTIPAGTSIMDRCNRCTCRAGKLTCTKKLCPIDGYWSSWSQWSTCRSENMMTAFQCQLGSQWRSRICVGAENNGAACQGVKTQQRQCRSQCDAKWSSWSQCSNECGIGFKTRIKAIPECSIKRNCPKERRPCHGELSECPIRWSSWSSWTKCIGGCGSDGHQLRSRQCSGEECDSRNDVESRKCIVKCPGEVSQWTDWSKCSRECDLGVRSRVRFCSKEFCHEVLKQIEPCFHRHCFGPDGDRNTTGGGGGHLGPISPDSCPKDMIFSPCVSLCTKRTCADSPSPAKLCEECIPGCVCPDGYLESSNGICIPESSCECTDNSGREWQNGATWTIRSESICETCSCTYSGIINCKKVDCDEFDDCSYSDWSDWSSCNSTCIGDESKRFRYRDPISGIYCSKTTEMSDCLQIDTPRCSDRCVGVEDGVSFKTEECTECSCIGGGELCVDLCTPTWSMWSSWSECPICGGSESMKSRKRTCSGTLCEKGSEEEFENCNIPECEANGDCSVTSQVRNFTREGCSAQNVVISYCSGRCSSQRNRLKTS